MQTKKTPLIAVPIGYSREDLIKKIKDSEADINRLERCYLNSSTFIKETLEKLEKEKSDFRNYYLPLSVSTQEVLKANGMPKSVGDKYLENIFKEKLLRNNIKLAEKYHSFDLDIKRCQGKEGAAFLRKFKNKYDILKLIQYILCRYDSVVCANYNITRKNNSQLPFYIGFCYFMVKNALSYGNRKLLNMLSLGKNGVYKPWSEHISKKETIEFTHMYSSYLYLINKFHTWDRDPKTFNNTFLNFRNGIKKNNDFIDFDNRKGNSCLAKINIKDFKKVDCNPIEDIRHFFILNLYHYALKDIYSSLNSIVNQYHGVNHLNLNKDIVESYSYAYSEANQFIQWYIKEFDNINKENGIITSRQDKKKREMKK